MKYTATIGRERFEIEIATREDGVLVVERSGAPMGVLIHDGATIPGAIVLGTVEVADGAIPLYGVRVTRAAVETEACPLFAPLVAQ